MVNASVGTTDRSRFSLHIVDDSGHILKSFDDDHQSDPRNSQADQRRSLPSPSEKVARSESWLVIVDPKRGTVAGRTLLPGLFNEVLPGGLFVRIAEDSSGGVRLQPVQVRVMTTQ